MSRVENGATLKYWLALHEIAHTLAGIMCLTQTLRYVVDQSRREADRQRQQHTDQISAQVGASSRTHGFAAALNIVVAVVSAFALSEARQFTLRLLAGGIPPFNECLQKNLDGTLDPERVNQQNKMMLQQNADNQSGQMDKAAEALAQLLHQLSRGSV